MRRNGRLLATSILFEGSGEAVEIPADEEGEYHVRLQVWDPNSPKDVAKVGIAWMLVER